MKGILFLPWLILFLCPVLLAQDGCENMDRFSVTAGISLISLTDK